MENGKGSNGGEATFKIGATLSDDPQSAFELAAFGIELGERPLTKRALHMMRIELGEVIPPRYLRGFRLQAEEFGRQLTVDEAYQVGDLVAEAIEQDRIEAETQEARGRLEDIRPDPIAPARVKCQHEREELVCGGEFAPKVQNIIGWVNGQLAVKTHREGDLTGQPVVVGSFVVIEIGVWKTVRAYCPQHLGMHRKNAEDGRSFSFERATSVVEMLNGRRAEFEEREAIRAERAARASRAESQLASNFQPPEVIVASNLPVNMAVQVIAENSVDRHAAREAAKRSRRAKADPFFEKRNGKGSNGGAKAAKNGGKKK